MNRIDSRRWVVGGRPRLLLGDGAATAFTRPGTPVLSAFSSALLEADRRAFTALVRHIAAVDADGTVVMVQVENETGLLGDSRDHAADAEAAWAAPTLALLGPDIYVDDVKGAVAGYVRADNALLVPESRVAVGNLFWAVGSGAIGFNVFGVDDVRPDGQFAAAYRLLAGAEDVIVTAQREGRIRPVLLEAGESAVVELGGLTWTVRGGVDVLSKIFLDAGVQVRTQARGEQENVAEALVPAPADMRAMGVLVDLGGDEVLVIGQGLMLEAAGAEGEVVEIDDAVEGRYEAGEWVSGRNLNGDERLNLLPLDRLAAMRVRVLRR